MRRYSLPDKELDAAVERHLAEVAAEAKAAFCLRLRGRGIQNRAVLRAFELVPRQTFVPHRYVDLASRDLALPIGCGQTLDQPWLIARMIEALAVEPTHRVLEIGAGTGYSTAILAQIANEVLALERFQGLANAAQARLTALGVANAAVVWADGLDISEALGPFDRILVHGVLDEVPETLVGALATDGYIVCARSEPAGQSIARLKRGRDGFDASRICPCHLQPIVPRLAAIL